MADIDVTRREVLTQAAYMAPAIVTLPVLLSFASAGSGTPGNSGGGGGSPGTPGNSGGGGGSPGTPGDAGDEGRHRRWERGRRHGWNRGRHDGWE
jgi:hypothetical protein